MMLTTTNTRWAVLVALLFLAACSDDYENFVKHPSEYKGKRVSFKRLYVSALEATHLPDGWSGRFEIKPLGDNGTRLSFAKDAISQYMLEEMKGSNEDEFKVTFECTEGSTDYGNNILSIGKVGLIDGALRYWWLVLLVIVPLFPLLRRGYRDFAAGLKTGAAEASQGSSSSITADHPRPEGLQSADGPAAVNDQDKTNSTGEPQ